MADYILLSVPVDDAEAAGLTEDAVIEMFVNGKGELIIRAADDCVCEGNCKACPLSVKKEVF